MTCPTCKGAGECYSHARSVSPFSGVPVNDPQCVEPWVCPRCGGDGTLGEPAWSDISLVDTLGDDDLGRFLADPNGFMDEEAA